MAKSSKPESSGKSAGGAKKLPAASAKSPAKKPAASASAAAAKKPAAAAASGAKSHKTQAAPQSQPLIDTNLAAQTAAAMVAHRASGGSSSSSSAASGRGASQPQGESSSFKTLKESLSKPSLGSLGGIIGPAGGQKKFSQHTGGPKQSGGGRNQTFGADVNRTGVPRRTSG